jgi:hypothetical protein
MLGLRGATVQVKPILLERGIAQKDDFHKLSPEFKKVFSADKHDEENIRIPVVGYTGHRKGEKAENVFAKNYRDTSI